jgi:integral membrane protein
VLKTPLGRLRVIGFIEGISFLALLGIAMPLKYFADMPLAVTIVGMMHGVLFILYVAAIAHAHRIVKWSRLRTFGALAAAVLPFGPFVLDVWLRREQSRHPSGEDTSVI